MYFIGCTKESFTPEIVLGSGCEGKVYYNQKTQEAVKIHYDNIGKESLSEEDALKLCNISTSNILLPRRLIYDENGVFLGYTTNFVPKYKHVEELDVEHYTVGYLISILSKLYKDAQLMSENGLVLCDLLSNGNYIFNGSYYLTDPGFYHFVEKDMKTILIENIRKLNTFLDATVFWCRINNLPEELLRRDATYTICDYLKDEGQKDETLNSLVRRKLL